jgi:hypothetical protein
MPSKIKGPDGKRHIRGSERPWPAETPDSNGETGPAPSHIP